MSRGPYRAGPWPGLTPRGALLLLGCALALAAGQLALGRPTAPLPDLPLIAALGLAPLCVAARLTRLPGAASAVCGAYLLPRSLLSVADPGIELPPLLLVPALAFDVCLWLRASDLAALQDAWPRRRRVWRTRDRRPRRIGRVRMAVAGAAFGVVMALIESGFAVFLGADPASWSGPDLFRAAGLSGLVCAVEGLAFSALSARDTGS